MMLLMMMTPEVDFGLHMHEYTYAQVPAHSCACGLIQTRQVDNPSRYSQDRVCLEMALIHLDAPGILRFS